MSDSSTPKVTRAIRRIVWPRLRSLGFEDTTRRNAWRRRKDTIDVVNFQAAVKAGEPLYLAGRVDGPAEASLGSFMVNAGTYYSLREALPWTRSAYARLANPERPEEWSCDRRLQLQKVAPQHPNYPPEIWEVVGDGQPDAETSVSDALRAIEDQALAWFDENANLEATFSELEAKCLSSTKMAMTEPDAFFRDEDLLTAVAIRLGRVDQAMELFQLIVQQEFDPASKVAYDKEEARRLRRLGRSRRAVAIEHLPFWHDGAMN